MRARVTSPSSEARRARELLRELEQDAHRLVARSLALAPPPGGRAWTRVADCADADAWLIVWSSRSGTGVHDHGASSGLVRVLRGGLVERSWVDDQSRARVRRIRAGRTASIDASIRHDVHNAGRHEAVSLHVYAPRLARMQLAPEPMSDHVDIVH